jgi:phage protein D/phage baseplate assembly protein gpV
MAATSKETVALYLITVGGTELDPAEANLVHEITISDYLRLPDVCALVVGYPAQPQGNPFQGLDDTAFVVGAELEVRLGSTGDMRTQRLFKGEIVTVEPSFQAGGVSLVVRAYDASHRMLRTRRQRAFTNQTASDIVERICGEYGLSSSTDSSGPPLDYVIQFNETDLDFIWRLAGRIGFEFVLDESGAEFRRPGTGADRIELRYPEDLHSFSPRITAVQQVDEVNVRGFDIKTKEGVEVSASSPGQVAEAGIRRSDVSGKFGETTLEIAGQSFASREEAQGIAQGMLDRLANAYLGADGSCHGDPRIKAGATLDVSGLGRSFSGTYRVTRAVHVLRGGGEYTTEFSDSPGEHLLSAQVGGNGSGRPGCALVIGLVTSNDDPEKLGRVKVKLPALSDTETFWAPVAVVSAGNERGLSMLPVPGEHVVVAFENGDTSYPYVLGSLFNGQDAPGDELAMSDGSFALRSDHTALVAAKEAITLRSDEGNWLIQIKGGDVEETVNSGRGGQGRYTGRFDGGWSLQAAQSVSIKSDMQVTIEAPQIKLQAQGPLQLQGNPVQIDGGSAVTVSGGVINLG